MVYLRFFLLLFFGLRANIISSEQDQSCQVKVIQECLDHSLGLLEAIESGNERLLIEKCDSLQVSPLAWSKKVPAM